MNWIEASTTPDEGVDVLCWWDEDIIPAVGNFCLGDWHDSNSGERYDADPKFYAFISGPHA